MTPSQRGVASTPVLGTVAGAVEVLLAFTDTRPERGVTDLAADLGMPKSRVHRLLTSLAESGLLVQVGSSRKYVLGPTLIALGERAARLGVLPRVAQPVLDRLARQTRESVVLCVPDGLGYRTVASAEGAGALRFATEPGRWFPGAGGATGHVLFAEHADAAIAERMLEAGQGDPAERHGPALTVTELRERHQAAVLDGYSVSRGEYDARVTAVAAPVRLSGRVAAAIAVVGPPGALEVNLDHHVGLVRAAAADLTQRLAA